METVSNFFRAVAEFLGWRKQRDAQQNAADVKLAQKGQDEANATKRTNDAIAAKDTHEIRNELAE